MKGVFTHMFIKHYHVLTAREALVSLSKQLPTNLLVDTVNEHGKFSIEFISKLTPEQLSKLKAECEKKKNKEVFLSFNVQTKPAPKLVEQELTSFSDFDWNKIADFKISGDTTPYQHSKSSEPFHYVSVVFVMKED